MKKSNKWGLIMCAVAFIIMILYLIFVDGAENLVVSISRIKIPFLIIAVGLIVLYWTLEAATVQLALKSLHNKQRFRNTLAITLIGQYFNCITPCASGGQPFQAYYLTKIGTPLASAMTALLARFITYQFTLTLLSAILLFLRFSYFITELRPLMVLTVIGFIINFAVILGLLALAFFKKFTTKLAYLIVKILFKLRIVKDYEKKLSFINEEMQQYSENFAFMKSQPLLIIKMLLLSAFQLLVYFSVSYILYLGFGLSGTDFLTAISCQSFVLMISSFVPLPGALGAAEGSYAAFFGAVFGNFTALSTFIWRFLTFYLPIVTGLTATIVLRRKSNDSNTNEETNTEEV